MCGRLCLAMHAAAVELKLPVLPACRGGELHAWSLICRHACNTHFSHLMYHVLSCRHSSRSESQKGVQNWAWKLPKLNNIYMAHLPISMCIHSWRQICLSVFACDPGKKWQSLLEQREFLIRTGRPTSAALRWRAPRPAAPALQPSSAWCSRSRPSLC